MLGECDRASDCSAFVTYMLEIIYSALAEGIATKRNDAVKLTVEMPVEMPSLSATAQKTLTAIAKHPSITMTRLAVDLAVNRRTVERNIKILQDKGLLVRQVPTKNGLWRVG